MQMAIIANLKKKFYFVAAGYFKFFANISLKRWHPRVIIITGSAGKTTMLNLVESQLGEKAHYSHNANSAFGIAFDILGQKGVTGSRAHWISLILKTPLLAFTYKRREKFYVVECDGERPHEAEFVAKWLKPEVSCWVSLGRSHAVFYEKEVTSGRFSNIDEAIALLEYAGFKFENGKLSADTPLNITYLTNDGTGHIGVAQIMQQDFAEIGINMTIDKREWNVFLDERKQGNFDFAREGWLADFNDPINMLEMWTSDSGNNDCQFGR